MANICELLINVVKVNRLKLLISLMTTGKEVEPKLSMLIKWNMVSLYYC